MRLEKQSLPSVDNFPGGLDHCSRKRDIVENFLRCRKEDAINKMLSARLNESRSFLFSQMETTEGKMCIRDSVYTPYHFMEIAKEYGYYADISYIMINKVMKIFCDRTEQVTINMNISDIYNYKVVHAILTSLRSSRCV